MTAPPARPGPALWRSGVADWFGRYPAVERARSRAGEWWADRSPSEQRLLLAFACVAALALLVTAVYRPLSEARAAALADIRTYETLAAQLRTAGPDLARLRTVQGGEPQTVLTTSASGYGLQLANLRRDGPLLRAEIADADFARVVQWLAQMEGTSALRLAEFRATRSARPGLVNVQLAVRG